MDFLFEILKETMICFVVLEVESWEVFEVILRLQYCFEQQKW